MMDNVLIPLQPHVNILIHVQIVTLQLIAMLVYQGFLLFFLKSSKIKALIASGVKIAQVAKRKELFVRLLLDAVGRHEIALIS